ncbi:MAG: phosphonate C-P lyase system protein PhnG [Coriobacteriia bacterium]|nr:phosphonate C-P lyase system protein PhnG [Coriobacteriia bacterium]
MKVEKMDKRRLTRILARADEKAVASLAASYREAHQPLVIKEPEKTLAMIKMREPVKQSLFYIGEVIVYEAVVEISGTHGVAACMCSGKESDALKVLNMAIIDAALNKGVFAEMHALLELERQQDDQLMKENALHLRTMVNFESLDQQAPSDLNAFKGGAK